MASRPDIIDHPEKIGIGTWDADKVGSALAQVEDFGFSWYYNWQSSALWTNDATVQRDASYVPMIWDETFATSQKLDNIKATHPKYLLGYNEPDNSSQSNMSVKEALNLWPQLMATGAKLGSPATTTGQTLGDGSWLDTFMSQAAAKNYRVDFVAVHYYPTTPDVAAFKQWLEDVHDKYGKPIWVTEWALIDWADKNRFSTAEIIDFARKATLMMDDLSFVKRHAWFSFYDDGTHLNTELVNAKGDLTAIGKAFSSLLGHTDTTSRTFAGTTAVDSVSGTSLADHLSGGGGSDTLKALAGKDRMNGGDGDDLLVGGSGNDRMNGGAQDDHLRGSWGNDHLAGGDGADILCGGLGKDLLAGGADQDIFVFRTLHDSGVTLAQRDQIIDFASGDRIDLSGIDAITGGSDNSFALDTNGSFSAGEIRQVVVNGSLRIDVNVDADHGAEFSVLLRDRTAFLVDADFIF